MKSTWLHYNAPTVFVLLLVDPIHSSFDMHRYTVNRERPQSPHQEKAGEPSLGLSGGDLKIPTQCVYLFLT